MVHQTHQVFNKCPGARPSRNVIRVSKTPLVDSHAPIVLGEKRDLLPPTQQVATCSVGKDDGLALAETLVVYLDTVYLR
jgi:hypothetical protein